MSFTKRRLVCATVNRTAPSLPKLRHTEQQIKTPTPSPDTDADVGRPEGRIRAEADRTPTTPYLATAGSWRYVGYQFKSGGLVEELTFNGPQIAAARRQSNSLQRYRFSGGISVIDAENCACFAGSTGLCLIVVLAGFLPRKLSLFQFVAGLIGLGANPPPQFGQTSCRTRSTQLTQNVHSYEQIRASSESGGSFLLQCSQVGRSSSIDRLRRASVRGPAWTRASRPWDASSNRDSRSGRGQRLDTCDRGCRFSNRPGFSQPCSLLR